MQAQMNLASIPFCMQMATPSMVIIGLANGTMAGWDLSTNTLNYLPAHSGANPGITFIKKLDSILLTGDKQGHVQIRNTTDYQLALPEAVINSQATVTYIEILRMSGEDWMLVGDSKGLITAVKADPSNQAQVTFGAFNDRHAQNLRVILMFIADEGKTLYALGEWGILRRWSLT